MLRVRELTAFYGASQALFGMELAVDAGALELHDAALRRQQAHDGIHSRGLAHAVSSHQGHHFAGVDGEFHAEQGLARAVEGF